MNIDGYLLKRRVVVSKRIPLGRRAVKDHPIYGPSSCSSPATALAQRPDTRSRGSFQCEAWDRLVQAMATASMLLPMLLHAKKQMLLLVVEAQLFNPNVMWILWNWSHYFLSLSSSLAAPKNWQFYKPLSWIPSSNPQKGVLLWCGPQ